MANYPYKQLGIELNRQYRNDLNKNFVDVEHDFRNILTKFDDVVEIVSDKAFDKVVDAAKLEWLSPVDTFGDLATTYPNATEGQTVMVRDTGKIYRWNGKDWIEIQDIDPKAMNELEARLNERLDDMRRHSFKIRFKGVYGARTLRIRNTQQFIRLKPVGTVQANIKKEGLLVSDVGFGGHTGYPFRLREDV